MNRRQWFVQLARKRAGSVARWAGEVAGVVLISAGAWIAWEPAGFAVAGGYLVLIANMRSTEQPKVRPPDDTSIG